MVKSQYGAEISRLHKNPMMSLTPYAELMRLSKPVGTLMILHSLLIGVFFTIITTYPLSRPWSVFYTHLPWICASAFFYRSFACVWSDIVDAKLDRLVERTRMRPMARGAIPVPAACTLATLLLLLAVGTMVPIAPSINGLLVYRLPEITMTLLYPLGKRITNLTQFYVGFVIACGVFTGAYLAGFDILAHLATLWSTRNSWEIGSMSHFLNALEPRTMGLAALFFSQILCVVTYDTIYGFQDVRDDRKSKLKSMAVLLGKSAKTFLTGLAIVNFCLLSYAAVAIHPSRFLNMDGGSFPAVLGIIKESWNYWIFSVLGSCMGWFYVLLNVDLNDPKSCGFWFQQAVVWPGNSILIGLVAQYVFVSIDS
jgi:4-hydroxybenzoate polyprenyltransferase